VQVGVSSWFGNVAEYEERVREGKYDKPYPVTDNEQLLKELYLADLVEPLGFDAFWTIEHHFSPYGMTTNPIQLLTYMAARTKRINVGSMILVIPWHNPLYLAENISMLDNLLAGRRFIIGMGRGFAAREYNALNIPYATSRERMAEVLDIVRIALTQEFFSYDGEFFQIPRTTIRPRPITSDLTRNMLMTWSSQESLEMAATAGLAPLSTNYVGWDQLASNLKHFNEIREKCGWNPLPSTIAVTVHCHGNHDRAVERGEHFWRLTTGTTQWHYDKLAREEFMPDLSHEEKKQFLATAYEGQASAGIFGTPESVIEQIRELQRLANVGHLITLHSFGDMPRDEVETSMRLFASEVLPVIREFPTEPIEAVPYEDWIPSAPGQKRM
jgi:alkanesulfonate monooxygenase SsuD/methylene tetrahydromethanopterin reductase-like flavin-dependent oxidoreductase (luciferase family)